MVIIVAETEQCYIDWCKMKDIDIANRNVKYATMALSLRGVAPRGLTIVTLCRWWLGKTPRGAGELDMEIKMHRQAGVRVISGVCPDHVGCK